DQKVAAAYIMRQLAEIAAAERIVAHVLDDASAIGMGMRPIQLFRCGVWEPLQQRGTNIGVPRAIDDGLMAQYRIRVQRGTHEQPGDTSTDRPLHDGTVDDRLAGGR